MNPSSPKLKESVINCIARLRASAVDRLTSRLRHMLDDSAVRRLWLTHGLLASKDGRYALSDIVGPLEGDNQLAPVCAEIGWRSDSAHDCNPFDGLDPDFYDVVATTAPRDQIIAQAIVNCDPLGLADRSRGGDRARLLDIGCGTGIVARVLRDLGFEFAIDSLDIAGQHIAHCRSYNLPRTRWIVGDATHVNLDERYLAVHAFMVHHHLRDFVASFQCVARALAPHGVFSYTDKCSIPASDERNVIGLRPIKARLSTGSQNPRVTVVRNYRGIHTRPHPEHFQEFNNPVGEIASALAFTKMRTKQVWWYQPYIFQFLCNGQ